ncbi:uncharacterized protein LOC143878581 isoform X1 [Tasmannia lanceolata]|uniref:uncharacterized protein LOC143878581 isoform X1 n=1 Tax=Tasmannia lanceolata TaxID=3420 RepID=UPI0040637653
MAENTRAQSKTDEQLKQHQQQLNELRLTQCHQHEELVNMINQLQVRLPSTSFQPIPGEDHSAGSATEGIALNQQHHNKFIRMDVPKFDGSDPIGWIFKVEQFFNYYSTSDEQRLLISSFHLEGPALSWYQWAKSNNLINSWKGFLDAIQPRFGRSLYSDPKVYGRPPPSMLQYIPGSSQIEAVDDELSHRDLLLAKLKTNLHQAQARMKSLLDQKRKDKEFEVGSWVLLKLQPYRQQSVVHQPSQKLSKRFYGPYQIKSRVGKVAYKLNLPTGSKIHPVFHISLLKPYYGPSPQIVCTLPDQSVDNQPVISPLAIVSERIIMQNDKPRNKC